ncbi:MAG: hypothetical protein FJY95_08480 [Candidatus Handelsmanbacteria bacterium]|nr:hypothetical protein [Candidatus Handelsmanbacteria bacterium]
MRMEVRANQRRVGITLRHHLRLFSTHPPAEERIARLVAMSRDLDHHRKHSLFAA